jgi:hypothetical protein
MDDLGLALRKETVLWHNLQDTNSSITKSHQNISFVGTILIISSWWNIRS